MRINIQVTVEPDRTDTPVVVEDFTIRANPATTMQAILEQVKHNTPDTVRKAVAQARAVDSRRAAEVAARR